ncbi:MAG: hypothetical protein KAR40_12830 [Candidatus Sabulitectum sp.]|nr:hypothetical protein [Candidatus Sabulitectum sp.]
MTGRVIVAVLFSFVLLAVADEANLSRIAVIPVFSDAVGNYDADELKTAAEEVFLQSGRFEIVDASSHADYQGAPDDQNLRLQAIAADLNINMFMLLDVSSPYTDVSHGNIDSLFVTRTTSVDVTGRFYTSEGSLLGSVREKKYSGSLLSSTTVDLESLALQAVVLVVQRSLNEIFPYEFTFTVTDGPVFSFPMGTDNGIDKGMVFSVVALSQGVPRSSEEYRQLSSHGILQITSSSENSGEGRLIAGNLVEGARVTAVENSTPGLLSLSYAVLPTEVVPGDNLSGEEAETSRLVNQAEFTGGTCKWGFSLSGTLFSGIMPRMSSIGIRGEMGTRLPLSSPSLALRAGIGFEACYLTQNTRADSISASANTATIAGTASVNLEWLFSSRFGIHAGCVGRLGSSADSWNVTDWRGYTRDALPGELYYAEIKQSTVSFSAGLTYMIY